MRHKPASKWAEYFETLPEFYSIPIFWPQSSRKCLSDYAQWKILKQIDNYEKVSKIVKRICDSIFGLHVDLQSLRWAYGTFTTRFVKGREEGQN